MRRSRFLGGFLLPSGLFHASLIKSVQYGTITINNTETSQTATITSVNTNQTALLFNGVTNTSGGVANGEVHLVLTNSTTVTATRGTSAILSTVSFCVVEYQAQVVRRIQRGTIAITAGNTSNTATITGVNTSKSVLSWLGQSTDVGDMTDGSAQLMLTNSTTVTATRHASTNNMTVGYQVIEWR